MGEFNYEGGKAAYPSSENFNFYSGKNVVV